MTSSSRRDATAPWVARALRHEVYAQPRGISQASRKYTGVTRNAEADQSCDVCGESLVYDPVTGLGGPYSDHDDDPTLDPAYPDPTPEDYCSMPLFHDGPCDSPLAHSPDEDDPRDMAWSLLSALDAYDDVPEWDDPDVDTVSLVMERARALALLVTAPEADPAYYSDGTRI
jgi:hypothetical protein